MASAVAEVGVTPSNSKPGRCRRCCEVMRESCVKAEPKVNCASRAPRIAANAFWIMGSKGRRWSRWIGKSRNFSASFAHDYTGALAHVRSHVDAVPALRDRRIGPLKHVTGIDRR